MTLVGIISDTHNRLPDGAIGALQGCDRIIHAGDICEPPILWELETIAPVTAVLGNNDHVDLGPSVNPTADVLIDGVRFVIVHEPVHLRAALNAAHERNTSFDGPVVGVYGHRHIPHLENAPVAQPCDLLISPGSVFRSREELGRRTVAKVQVENGRIVDAWVEDLLGNRIL